MSKNEKLLAALEEMHDAFHTVYGHMCDNMPDCGDDDYVEMVGNEVGAAEEAFRNAEKEAKSLIG